MRRRGRRKKQQRKQQVIIVSIIVLLLAMLVSAGAFYIHSKNEEKAQAIKERELELAKKKKDSEKKKIELNEKKADSEEENKTEEVMMKTTSKVNLRKGPGTEYEAIKLLQEGTEVKKLSEEGEWIKVQVGEDVGYISAEFLVAAKAETEQDSTKTEAAPETHRSPNGVVVVIDPGHQGSGDSTKEPNGPGSSVMKARVTSGTTGRFTGVAEYILNLQISLALRTELQNRGYTVHMTRTTHDINISNMERAQYATQVGADIAVRIHANGSTNSSVNGALTMSPSVNNPYVSHLANASYNLSKSVIDAYCAATGFKHCGVLMSDTMTGMNWSSVPVTIVEMGYMSNEHDDRAMQDANMQIKMVQGIANGIDAYFGF